MNRRLNISVEPILGEGDGSGAYLLAIDSSEYSQTDLGEHVMLDFITYGDNTIQNEFTMYNFSGTGPVSIKLPIKYDGIMWYTKLVIPKLIHFQTTTDQYQGIGGQLFEYNEKIYICNKIYNQEIYTINQILSNSEVVTNYIDAYNLCQENEASQTFYFPKLKIFVYLKLQACLVNMQKQLLLGTRKGLGSTPCSFSDCNTDAELKKQADFLLAALYVIEFLNDTGNYDEAQRILDNLATCNGLCDGVLETTKGCGCGNSK